MITSVSNNKVKFVRRLQADRRFREREGLFVAEGTRWLDEVAQRQHTPHTVYYTADWQARPEHNEILQQVEAPLQLVAPEVMAVMSDTETPPGALAVLPIPARTLAPGSDLLLILDEVRDPGNLGTMLRTAGAAGVDGVLLSPGCVDPYNPKVVRAGMGAHLRLAILPRDWDAIAALVQPFQVWLAAADGTDPYTDVNWRRPAALLIGSEARGAGPEARALAAGTVYIPMHAATESLNAAVAAGIILFEAVRQRR